MNIRIFAKVVLWTIIPVSIAVWIVFTDTVSFITIGEVLYFLGVLSTSLILRFGGEQFLRRFWPSALEVQSNVLRCLSQSIGVGMFIVAGLAGYIHLYSPELWKDSDWLLPMTFLVNTSAVFVASVLRSRLAVPRNL